MNRDDSEESNRAIMMELQEEKIRPDMCFMFLGEMVRHFSILGSSEGEHLETIF